MKRMFILLLVFGGCGSQVGSPPTQDQREPLGPRLPEPPGPRLIPDVDTDRDGVVDRLDVCPGFPDSADRDRDGIPDGCDACPNDRFDDSDGDGVCDSSDNCPHLANASQTDVDGDGRGDPCDPQPEPEPGPQLLAGTYVGTVQCKSVTTFGFLTTEADSSDIETVTFNSNGHFIQSGDPISVGDTFSRGNESNFFVVRFLNNSANAFDYGGEVIQSLPVSACNNTCFFAFDFVCDELQFCNLGTDCADCGPPVLTGTFEDIFQAQQDGSVRMLRSLAVFSEGGIFSLSFNCDGILSR